MRDIPAGILELISVGIWIALFQWLLLIAGEYLTHLILLFSGFLKEGAWVQSVLIHQITCYFWFTLNSLSLLLCQLLQAELTASNPQHPRTQLPTSQHLTVTVNAVVHPCKDVGQRGLAHAVLPDQHHAVAAAARLGGDDGVGWLRGPAPSVIFIRTDGVSFLWVVLIGVFLDQQILSISRDAPSLLLLVQTAVVGATHGNIVESHF